MATITLKDIPEDVHAQLKSEAEANLRTLDQEVMIRLQRSFDVADQFSTEAVNNLIDEAIASGAEKEFTVEQMRERFDQTKINTRNRLAAEIKAA